jgi:WD40 repeat protein
MWQRGMFITSSQDSVIRIFDEKTNKIISRYKVDEQLLHLEYDQEHWPNMIVGGNIQGTVFFWDVRKGLENKHAMGSFTTKTAETSGNLSTSAPATWMSDVPSIFEGIKPLSASAAIPPTADSNPGLDPHCLHNIRSHELHSYIRGLTLDSTRCAVATKDNKVTFLDLGTLLPIPAISAASFDYFYECDNSAQFNYGWQLTDIEARSLALQDDLLVLGTRNGKIMIFDFSVKEDLLSSLSISLQQSLQQVTNFFGSIL